MAVIALLGFGVIGSGTAEVLTKNKKLMSDRLGCDTEIRYILDLREFPDSPFANLIVHDINTVLDDEEVDIVVEMMGGSHPAYEYSLAALTRKKSVVTSNKQVVAEYGEKLTAAATENGVKYLYEASVGGGIPIIRPLQNDLSAYKINSVDAILNGTTNYILTQMAERGSSFDDALAEARVEGYAEANPSNDIEGIDSARKILILTAIITGKMFTTADIGVTGITKIVKHDIVAAEKAGCSVKLIAHMDTDEDKISMSVAPMFVSRNNPLATINGVFNGIMINADELGDVMFYGRGAGKYPTAGAVISDIVDIIVNASQKPVRNWKNTVPTCPLAESGAEKRRYCLTLKGGDISGAAEALPADCCLTPVYSDGELTSLTTNGIDRAAYNALVAGYSDRIYSIYGIL